MSHLGHPLRHIPDRIPVPGVARTTSSTSTAAHIGYRALPRHSSAEASSAHKTRRNSRPTLQLDKDKFPAFSSCCHFTKMLSRVSSYDDLATWEDSVSHAIPVIVVDPLEDAEDPVDPTAV